MIPKRKRVPVIRQDSQQLWKSLKQFAEFFACSVISQQANKNNH